MLKWGLCAHFEIIKVYCDLNDSKMNVSKDGEERLFVFLGEWTLVLAEQIEP